MASFDHLQEGDRGVGRNARFAFIGRCLEYFVSTGIFRLDHILLWQVKRQKNPVLAQDPQHIMRD